MKKNHIATQHNSIRWKSNQSKARSVLQGMVIKGGYPLAESKTQMDRGYLYAVVHGTKPASKDLLLALEVVKPPKRRTSLNMRINLVTATDLSNLIHRAMLGEPLPTLHAFVERVDKLVTKRMKSQTPLS